MAREQVIEERRRLQVSPQETFDFTTPDLTVGIHPVDYYIQPAAGQGWQQLAQALSVLNPALQAYAQYQVEQYQRDFEAGRLARATGQERLSKSLGMIRGWETLDGALKALEFKKEINAFFAQNYANLSPEELAAALDEIERRYLEGMTEWQQRGFVEKALPAREQVEMNYVQAQAQLIRQQSLDRMSQLAYDEVHEALERGLAAVGLTFADAPGNPVFYELFLNENNRKNLASYIRSIITRAQNTIGKDLGLTKNEVSALYVEQLGELAVQLGLPELLDAAYIKDYSGISIEGSTLGEKVRRYRERAEAARESYIDAWTRQQRELEKQRKNELMIKTHHVLTQLYLMEDRRLAAQEAHKWINVMAENPDYLSLDEEDHAKLLKAFRDIAEGQFSFPERSNDYVFIDLRRKSLQGTLTWQDIDEAIMGLELNRADAEKLMQDMARIEEMKAANEGKLPPWPHKEFIMDLQDSMISLIGARNELGVFTAEDAAVNAELLFTEELMLFLEANGRFPTFWEWQEQIADKVLRVFGLSIADIYTKTGSGAPGPTYGQVDEEEQQEQGVLRRLFNRVGQTVARGRNWLADRFGFLEFLRVPEEIPDAPEARFDDNTSFEFLHSAFMNGRQVPAIRQFLLNEGEPPEAVQRYFDMYRFRVARFFLLESGDRPTEAVQNIYTLLRAAGYNDKEIQQAIDWVRFEAQGGIDVNGGTE